MYLLPLFYFCTGNYWKSSLTVSLIGAQILGESLIPIRLFSLTNNWSSFLRLLFQPGHCDVLCLLSLSYRLGHTLHCVTMSPHVLFFTRNHTKLSSPSPPSKPLLSLEPNKTLTLWYNLTGCHILLGVLGTLISDTYLQLCNTVMIYVPVSMWNPFLFLFASSNNPR